MELSSNSIIDLVESGKRLEERVLFRESEDLPEESKNLLYSYRHHKADIEDKDSIPLRESYHYYKIGNTQVITGITLEESAPFKDSPDKGNLAVDIAIAEFVNKLIKDRDVFAIEVSRFVDRTIRSAKFIDMRKLVISEGLKVYSLFIDGIVTNNDGNILDTAVRSSVVTLAKSKIGDSYLPLNFDRIPLSYTFAKVGNKIVLDPSSNEELASSAMLAVGIANDKIVSLQQIKSNGLKKDEILLCVKTALEIYKYEKKIIIDLVKK
ncbi:MAG: hypothetical protein QXX36_00560 [Candidatus Rehaiarchaeum fermentans]|nr:hypothetical protein [Candidatus Rehaiarchaeum fermentans]MCW1302118.1 hypothetical protein [Candidatus Rehaiarchaeum fermentans]